MVRAAVFGAEDVVGAHHARLEPQLGVAPGNRVDLRPKRREVETVDDVLGRDRDQRVGAARQRE